MFPATLSLSHTPPFLCGRSGRHKVADTDGVCAVAVVRCCCDPCGSSRPWLCGPNVVVPKRLVVVVMTSLPLLCCYVERRGQRPGWLDAVQALVCCCRRPVVWYTVHHVVLSRGFVCWRCRLPGLYAQGCTPLFPPHCCGRPWPWHPCVVLELPYIQTAEVVFFCACRRVQVAPTAHVLCH